MAGWIMIVVVVLLLILGLPVAFAMFIAGAIGHLLVVGPQQTIASIPIVLYNTMSMYTLTVIPLFVLMGFLASFAGFANDAFAAAQKWVGRLPGSLAQATILAGTAFAAACGTTIAACAALGKICIPPMRKAGVDEKLAIGAVAAAAPLSVMIPPSVIMPIYGIITEQSVGKLLIAGIIPGIVSAVILMALVYTMCKIRPELARTVTTFSWKERLAATRKMWGISILFLIVIGGIYTGIMTPTETGAVGAFAALALGLASRRLSLKNGIMHSFAETLKATCTILIIVACALYFSHFLAISRVPTAVTSWLVGLQMPRVVILAGILIMYIAMGCIMDTLSMMLITLPVIFPAIVGLGYDPIWFGVLMVMEVEIAALTPPFGINLFILRGSLPEVSMAKIVRAVIPFILAYLVILVILVAFPQLSLFLPNKMMSP